MSKRKMYGLLAFILLTFGLLGAVVAYEIKNYPQGEKGNNSLTGESPAGVSNEGTETSDTDGAEEAGTSGTQTPTSPDNTSEGSGEGLADADTSPTPAVISPIHLFFAGDIYLSDVIVNNYKKQGIEGIVDSKLLSDMKDADITMVNQEFTFSNGGTAAEDKQYTFRVDPSYVTSFKDMGIDIVTLANNHSMDFGTSALKDSFSTLTAAGIEYAGAGNNITEAREIHYEQVQDKTIAFLAASRVIPVYDWNAADTKAGMLTTYDPALLLEDISTAGENSDFVVVYLHWGIEREERPEDYQRNLAKQYIDAGADLVIGSHPHVLQGLEYYKGKPIIYSLGNYIFYSNIKQTAVLKITLDEELNSKVQLLPAKAENGNTKLLEDSTDIAEFYCYMEGISYEVGFDKDGYAYEKQ